METPQVSVCSTINSDFKRILDNNLLLLFATILIKQTKVMFSWKRC